MLSSEERSRIEVEEVFRQEVRRGGRGKNAAWN